MINRISANDSRLRWLLPALICLITFFTFAHFSRSHPIGTFATETDFYHLFAPDADRLSAGQFPQNDFQGPGYPALIALVTKLTGDTFISGKCVSVVSAAFISLLVFVLFARLFGYWVGIGTSVLWAVAPEIPQFSIGATTDVNFLLLCLAALCVFTSTRLSANWRVILAGVISSLSYLSRYNGLFLLVTFLFAILLLNIFERAWKERARLAILFIAAFLVTSSPWLYANYKHNGSPFYNVNYLNIATEFYPELVNGNVFQDGTRPLREKFHSFGDVLLYNPARIATHYPANLFQSFVSTINDNLVTPVIGICGLIGFGLALWLKRHNKAVLTMLAAFTLYFLLMGLSHWEARYYFFIGVGYAGLAVYAVSCGWDFIRSRMTLFRKPILAILPAIIVIALFAHSFVYAKENLTEFLGSHPMEIAAARDYIWQQHGQAKRGLRIVSRKPHLAYLSHQEWVFLPQMKSIDELRKWMEENRVDYLAIGKRELRDRKELSALGDPKTAPAWLEAVWVNQKPLLILYRLKTVKVEKDLRAGN